MTFDKTTSSTSIPKPIKVEDEQKSLLNNTDDNTNDNTDDKAEKKASLQGDITSVSSEGDYKV